MRLRKAVAVDSGRALILLAHGSRSRKSLEEMRILAKRLRKQAGIPVAGAFLELARPTLPEAVSAAVLAGAREIHVLPMFLFSGKHAGGDVPALAKTLRAHHPGVRLRVLPALGRHPALLSLLREAAGF